MARFTAGTIEAWTAKADAFLGQYDLTRTNVVQGGTAWSVASRCGILEEAYRDREVTDGHIQTALERVFPRAVFKDAKRY